MIELISYLRELGYHFKPLIDGIFHFENKVFIQKISEDLVSIWAIFPRYSWDFQYQDCNTEIINNFHYNVDSSIRIIDENKIQIKIIFDEISRAKKHLLFRFISEYFKIFYIDDI